MFYRFQFLQLTLCILLLLSIGCGGDSNIGKVEGVVSLDGEPLKRALVCFYPTDGRASAGQTDEEGHYELQYIRNVKGAVVGPHKVTISTYIDREDDPLPANSVAKEEKKRCLPGTSTGERQSCRQPLRAEAIQSISN